jgi:hypothetical protein
MADEKKEKWLNYLALSTVIFAVCATLSTFRGGGYGSKALLNQTKASDQWSLFQSKSIKSYIFESQRDNLELQKEIVAKGPKAAEDMAHYDKRIDVYDQKLKKYEDEKAEISAKAKGYEKDVIDCQKHGAKFGIAVIFLQVTILLSSIAGLMKKRMVWYFSMVIGIIGIVFFVDGFFLFF